MAIFWREDLKRRWAIMVYVDPYTFAEARKTFDEILAHPISTSPVRLLIDRRHCAPPDADFVNRSLDLWCARGARMHNARIAVVVGANPASYGMARMGQITAAARNMPIELELFHEWDAAENWLAERTPRHEEA